MKSVRFVITLILATTILAGCWALEGASREDAEEADYPHQVVLPTVSRGAALPRPLCSDPQPPFITDFDVYTPPSLDRPPARSPFRDPVFGSCIVRVTDRTADLTPGDESPGLKNEYSRVDSFNADGSYILVFGTEAEWYLYDAASLLPL